MRLGLGRLVLIGMSALAVTALGPRDARGDVCAQLPADAQAGMVAACEAQQLLEGRADDVERDRQRRALDLRLRALERAREGERVLPMTPERR